MSSSHHHPAKNKGKGKKLSTGTPNKPSNIQQCPPYLPPTNRIAHLTMYHSQCISISALTLAINESNDGDSFSDYTLTGNLVQVIESFLRYRPVLRPSSIDRVLDLLVYAWFRKLAVLLATPAVCGRYLIQNVLPQLSVLAIVDFAKSYGHINASKDIVNGLLDARPSLQLELDDVVRIASLYMGQLMYNDQADSQQNGLLHHEDTVSPSVVADALVGLDAVLRLAPEALVTSFDDEFLSRLSTFYDLVLIRSVKQHVLDVAVSLGYTVIRYRFLTVPDTQSVNQLISLIQIIMDSSTMFQAHDPGSDTLITKSFLLSLALESSLLNDLKAIDPALFHGDMRIVDRLTGLCVQLKEQQSSMSPPPPKSISQYTDPYPKVNDGIAQAFSQVQDLFPDLASNHISSLLDQYANNTEELINALLTDPSLLQRPPLPTPEIDKELQAKTLARVREMSNLAIIAKPIISRQNDFKETKTETKRKVLTYAARIAQQDMEEEMYEDEYDDTYDTIDTGIVDGDLESTFIHAKPKQSLQQPDPTREFETVLFQTYQTDPNLFDRINKKSRERSVLREQTGLSDEQIEGWAAMLKHIPARMRHFENKYQFSGNRPLTDFHYPQDIDRNRCNPSNTNTLKMASRGGYSKRGHGGEKKQGSGDRNTSTAGSNRDILQERVKAPKQPDDSAKQMPHRRGRRGKINKDGKVY